MLLPVSVLALIVPATTLRHSSSEYAGQDLEQFQDLHKHSYDVLFDNSCSSFCIFPSPELPKEVREELYEILHLEFEEFPHTEERIIPASFH